MFTSTPFFLIFLLSMTHFSLTPSKANSNCPKRCGEVEIIHPFGISKSCSLPGFEVICRNDNTAILADLADLNLTLLEISKGQVRVDSTPLVVESCTGETSTQGMNMSLSGQGPYTIPVKANTFMLVGCGAFAYVSGGFLAEAESKSMCEDGQVPVDGSCAGAGCSQTSLPRLTKSLLIMVLGATNDGNITEYSNCRYGFVVENGGYRFKKSDIDDFKTTANISMRLEWAVGEGKCMQAMESTGYMCGSNTQCMESDRGSGYLCSCMDGYRGNPYVNGSLGCQGMTCIQGEESKFFQIRATDKWSGALRYRANSDGLQDATVSGARWVLREPDTVEIQNEIIESGIVCDYRATEPRADSGNYGRYYLALLWSLDKSDKKLEACQSNYIDECSEDSELSQCVPEATCHNEVPFFRCVCPKGSSGDGRKDGSKCVRSLKIIQIPIIKVVTGVISCLGGIILCVCWSFWAFRKQKIIKLRTKYFEKNGGILLQQHLSSHIGSSKCTRIYSAKELKRATNNYNSNRILGSGGHGTVYKGVFEDGTIVAIKKSQLLAESQINQFLNEVLILTQINHKNVVRLLGCCLQTEVPMLVYEFIPNGSLYEKIHVSDIPSTHISWEDRRRIAIEITEALSYLHSFTSRPVYHRDVKSSNILLGENYNAKLADFGLSKLVPLDKSKLSTEVQGTLGYLDPEYFHTGKLTAKSDVYSFGVVLVELISGRKPLWLDPSVEHSDLATFFLSCVSNGNLVEVLDPVVVLEGKLEELLSVVDIARDCLKNKGDERPLMREVLQGLLGSSVGYSLQHLQQTKKEEDQEMWCL